MVNRGGGTASEAYIRGYIRNSIRVLTFQVCVCAYMSGPWRTWEGWFQIHDSMMRETGGGYGGPYRGGGRWCRETVSIRCNTAVARTPLLHQDTAWVVTMQYTRWHPHSSIRNYTSQPLYTLSGLLLKGLHSRRKMVWKQNFLGFDIYMQGFHINRDIWNRTSVIVV